MEKILNWDSVDAKGMEDFKLLPVGAYECIIKSAKVHTNEQNGKRTFKVEVDVCSGEFKNYFQLRFNNNTNTDKKWDNNATRYLAFEGDNVAYFKGFITCIENSNVGYKWDWDETKLTGKKICGVFGYEEYEKQDGSKAVKVRLNKFRSTDKMNEVNIDYRVRLLNGNYMDIDEYNEKKEEKNDPFSGLENVVEIGDDFLD